MNRPERFRLVVLLRGLRREFAVDDDLAGVGGQTDVGLHLGQQPGSDLVGGDPAPVDVFPPDPEVRVDAVKGADEILEQDCHLPFVLHEVHELAGAGLLGHEQVAVDQFAHL